MESGIKSYQDVLFLCLNTEDQHTAGIHEAQIAYAKKALTGSVTDAGAPGKDPYYGYGALDAAAAARLEGK